MSPTPDETKHLLNSWEKETKQLTLTAQQPFLFYLQWKRRSESRGRCRRKRRGDIGGPSCRRTVGLSTSLAFEVQHTAHQDDDGSQQQEEAPDQSLLPQRHAHWRNTRTERKFRKTKQNKTPGKSGADVRLTLDVDPVALHRVVGAVLHHAVVPAALLFGPHGEVVVGVVLVGGGGSQRFLLSFAVPPERDGRGALYPTYEVEIAPLSDVCQVRNHQQVWVLHRFCPNQTDRLIVAFLLLLFYVLDVHKKSNHKIILEPFGY